MLYLTVSLCWAACALAAPATEVVPLEKQQPTVIPIVSQSEEFEPNGTYKFSYETGNGIKREESSYTKLVPRAQGRSAESNEGGESSSEEIHVQEGSYSYTAPDGTLISVRYIADENGFRPIGNHIPTIRGLAPSVSSAEKSGRALKVADNAEAGSVSASKSVPKLEARSGVASDDSKSAEIAKPTEVSSEASKIEGTTEVSSTELSKTSEMQTEVSKTEAVSSTDSSTLAASAEQTSTKAASTEAASTELSTTVSEKVDISTQAQTTASLVDASSTEFAKTDSTTELAKTEPSTTTESATTAA